MAVAPAQAPAPPNAAQAVTATFSAAGGFTDNPLVPQTTAEKTSHVGELRTAFAAARARNGLPVFTGTDPTFVPGTAPIKAVHIRELRRR